MRVGRARARPRPRPRGHRDDPRERERERDSSFRPRASLPRGRSGRYASLPSRVERAAWLAACRQGESDSEDSGGDDASDDDDDDDDDDEDDDADGARAAAAPPPPLSVYAPAPATERELAAQREARRARFDGVLPGKYAVRVHIIQVRVLSALSPPARA